MDNIEKGRGFTGWHMASVMVAFFGTIITANLTMAYYARSSWSGMLSKNTYVASQDFNIKTAQAREWARQGFRGKVDIDGSVIRYFLDGPAEALTAVTAVRAALQRPVGAGQDFEIELRREEYGSYSASHELEPGPWIVDIEAKSGGRTVFHQAERIVVAEQAR